MLPKAKELDIDFEALGPQMLDRKKQLHKDGVPSDAEDAMVAQANGRGDSPAAAAQKRQPAAKRKTRAKLPRASARKNRSQVSR